LDYEKILEITGSSMPEELDFPVFSSDHSGHIEYLAMKGYVKVAADHVLHKEMVGDLNTVVGGVIRRFDITFNRASLNGFKEEEIIRCCRAYETMFQMALNLIGLERKIIGFSEDEASSAVTHIKEALGTWENLERKRLGGSPIARGAVERVLSDMKIVMSKFYRPPGSMVAYIAKNIEKQLEEDNVANSFLEASEREIRGNIYYRMADLDMCRFGNDYALGLRWLRHLGFVQVSTNPVLAAIAYQDDPTLWDGFTGEDLCPDFKNQVEKHPEWIDDPEAYGDEIAAAGTEVSIWPNLAVFRPIAVASDMRHGMVSLQLNPKIADKLEESLRDAIKIYIDASKFLERYDHYLLWGFGWRVERGRPNIVFKVSGSSPAAIELTRRLEAMGIGTNNTVTFTVSQESRLILAKIEGRAEAVKKGIPLTTVYETNMGGRLDDHIREVQAELLLSRALEKIRNKEEALERLSKSLGASEETRSLENLQEKIRVVCSRRYLRPLNKQPFIDFLSEAYGEPKEKVSERLAMLEADIGSCGILVTKRVYELFFSPENRMKWLSYIKSRFGLSEEEAEQVLNGIDVLPASKRKPPETLESLGRVHMTNTEFPNHQLSVLLFSSDPNFNLERYRESVLRAPDPEVVKRLTERWSDISKIFLEAYELTPYLRKVMEEAGIKFVERYGLRGLKPEFWGRFGATEKTMREFSKSYERFRAECVDYVRRLRGSR